ncbi:NAD-dependent epimerase/dehydratase family protein [Curtobacterium sp. MCPF17_052]|uniref:NAD-dependent epimerase/dehydratase family protein n=1 Tax=Curtobacterium sp. MCPF17_052 TaxID=2175655 RepID=UPI003464CBD6
MTRIVVVGATGNVGTALLRRFRDAGADVVGVARRRPDLRAQPYDSALWHTVDVGAPDAIDRLTAVFRGADAVVHLAWALQPTHDIPAQHRTDVTGTANVLAAVAAAGVPQVVVASSVGAYRGVDVDGKRTPVDESWPADGIPTATYSIHKAENERAMDVFEREHPEVVVTRLRPGLVFQRDAAAEIRGLFLGHLVPMRVVRWIRWAVLPLPYPFVFQAVHADDLADAYWRAIDRKARGAFNIAATPRAHAAADGAGVRDARSGPRATRSGPRARHADLAAAPAAHRRRLGGHRGRCADHAHGPCARGARLGGTAQRRGRHA